MFKNYLKVAWRNLHRNKLFSLINILGLSVGLACCMLIGLYIKDQFSYDRQHEDAKDIYRLATAFRLQEREDKGAPSAAPIGPAMLREFPQIEKMARLYVPFDLVMAPVAYRPGSGSPIAFYEKNGYFADAAFFDIFNYNFLEGTPHTALEEPYSVVISEEMAHKLFGKAAALNKIIRVNINNGERADYRVTGVFRQLGKSHINGHFFMSLNSGSIGQFVKTVTDFATNNVFFTYFKLKPGTNAADLDKQFPAFVERYESKDLKAAGFYKAHFLQPVTDIHLRSSLNLDFAQNSSITFIRILGLIAIFILIIACINFMNLSTARSSKRAVEVGIRKVIGANHGVLIRQFLGESLLTTLLALILAVSLVNIVLPMFNNLASTDITFRSADSPSFIIGFLGLTIVTGLLSGSYPAFYLSSFRPVKVLKGKLQNSFSATIIRKGLVVLQFGISICLILSSLVIYQQVGYFREKDLGFRQDQEIIVPLVSNQSKKIYEVYREALLSNKDIRHISGCSYYPGTAVVSDKLFYSKGKTINQGIDTKTNYVDYDLLKTLNIPLLAGRFFSTEYAADTAGNRIVLNEKAARKQGWTPDAAIGKKLYTDFGGVTTVFEVVGVTRDFNFEGLQKDIEPYSFELGRSADHNDNGRNYMIVQAEAAGMQGILQFMAHEWKKLNQDDPFDYYFLDQQFRKTYEAEQRTGDIITVSTAIAVLISCLGLYGLALFTAEQKIREIGIRKVLGASVQSIVGLLSREFLQLVLFAALIAFPVGWFFMHRWLQHFAYHVSISWWLFLATATMAFCIAFVTVGGQALKASLANPVRNLRNE